MTFLPRDPSIGPIRLLTMDGGGIYGLATATLLRKLCEQNSDFLATDQIWMLAGTSAGALNALLLACEKNPRDVALSGKLEAFWAEPGIYANNIDPVASALSYSGLTSWFGTQDFLELLHKYFGDATLGQLKQRVLITTFNWSGSDDHLPENRNWRPKMFCNFPDGVPFDEVDRHRTVVEIAYAAASPPGFRAVLNGYGDGGTFVPNPALNAMAKTLEYFEKYAQFQLGETNAKILNRLQRLNRLYVSYLTAIQNNLKLDQEGLDWRQATNDSLNFLQSVQETLLPEWYKDYLNGRDWDPYQNAEQLKAELQTQGPIGIEIVSRSLRASMSMFFYLFDQLHKFMIQNPHYAKYADDIETLQSVLAEIIPGVRSEGKVGGAHDREGVLARIRYYLLFHVSFNGILDHIVPNSEDNISRIALLSLGVCTRPTAYGLKSFDFGPALFGQLPTNLMTLNVYPPSMQISLDAPSDQITNEMRRILGNGFHRMSPPLLGPPYQPPTLMAMTLARFDPYRAWLIEQIQQVCESREAQEALEKGLAFLSSDAWRSSFHSEFID